MDQQNQEQQKKKRPYHNNHRHRNGNKGADQRPATEENTRQQSKARNESQSHRPPQATNNSSAEGRERNENRENKTPVEHRDGRGGNARGRSGNKGRPNDNNRPSKDNAPSQVRGADERSAENRSAESRGGDNRNNRRNDRNRPRREERRPVEDTVSRREIAPKDEEMDSWFAPASAEPKPDPIFSSPVTASASQEPLPNLELDLNDILPPIVLEKYSEPSVEAPVSTTEAPTEEGASEPIATVEVVGIRFNKTGKVYYFDPNGTVARRGDAVIVETARGPEFGEVWQPNHTVKETDIVPPLRPVIRLADDKDKHHNADNARREDEAFRICLDKIRAHGLDMKLVDAQYTFDNSKLLFYFTSAGRVDFRELVKDLASVFRTRIELRQIGIRDEAKLMGGLGICGRPLCCASFLSDFTQVSIKMAKEQNLSLNSAKISGTCGRLMCCLNYEYPVYCEAARRTPSVGTTVATPDGTGTVTETQPLAGMVKVSLANAPSGTVPQYYRVDAVRVLSESRRRNEDEKNTDEDEQLPNN